MYKAHGVPRAIRSRCIRTPSSCPGLWKNVKAFVDLSNGGFFCVIYRYCILNHIILANFGLVAVRVDAVLIRGVLVRTVVVLTLAKKKYEKTRNETNVEKCTRLRSVLFFFLSFRKIDYVRLCSEFFIIFKLLKIPTRQFSTKPSFFPFQKFLFRAYCYTGEY